MDKIKFPRLTRKTLIHVIMGENILSGNISNDIPAKWKDTLIMREYIGVFMNKDELYRIKINFIIDNVVVFWIRATWRILQYTKLGCERFR
jgi:hypothetical protein